MSELAERYRVGDRGPKEARRIKEAGARREQPLSEQLSLL